MPLYEYRCGECGNDFELMRPRGAMDDAARCPKCTSMSPKRRLSVVAPLRVALAPLGDPDFVNPYGLGDDDDDDDDFGDPHDH